jgi:hypothetical protein
MYWGEELVAIYNEAYIGTISQLPPFRILLIL